MVLKSSPFTQLNTKTISTEALTEVLALACNTGIRAIKNNEAPCYSDSTVSEIFLVSLIKKAMDELGYGPERVQYHGGHTFPDVSIAGTGFGIELKGAKSSRKFNGNSVMAGTMLPNLTKIYLMYWIEASKEIGFKDYFECVASNSLHSIQRTQRYTALVIFGPANKHGISASPSFESLQCQGNMRFNT